MLGTLPGRARARLAHIARTDTVVAARIRAWEQRLAPLAEARAADHAVAARVEAASRCGSASTPVRPRERGPWWTRVGFWRGFALASFVAALALARRRCCAPQPRRRSRSSWCSPARTRSPRSSPRSTRGSRTMTVKVVGGAPVPPDRSLELWMLPDGAAAALARRRARHRRRPGHAARRCPTSRSPTCRRSRSASSRRAARPPARRRARCSTRAASRSSTDDRAPAPRRKKGPEPWGARPGDDRSAESAVAAL